MAVLVPGSVWQECSQTLARDGLQLDSATHPGTRNHRVRCIGSAQEVLCLGLRHWPAVFKLKARNVHCQATCALAVCPCMGTYLLGERLSYLPARPAVVWQQLVLVRHTLFSKTLLQCDSL